MAEPPGADELLFVPLGGTGEIGMNLYLYGHAGAWLMVDLGITFADERLPGIDVLMPDPAFIEARRDHLAGLVLTHAHEDHLGAVEYLWPRLRCPVYATPFTCAVLRRKLDEAGLLGEVELTELELSARFPVGPFEVELISLTHSIPEPSAVLISTPLGQVLHTGDWKLDPDPLVGGDYDDARLQQLAGENVLALVGDSTNALVAGSTGSEAEVRAGLMTLVGGLKERVAVTCFATNVARLQTVAEVAEAHGRSLALVGRSMHRLVDAARETGYLHDLPPLLDESEVRDLPRDKVMMLVTGSQGESRSALARISRGEHPQVALEEGDAVIFSSRIIPGNETAIFAVQNRLMRAGVQVITEEDEDHLVHVSGHPAREELAQMYSWVRPRLAVPVHGEPRHLMAHARLARSCQVPEVMVPHDGSVVRLAPSPAAMLEDVEVGRLALDGSRIVPVDSPAIRGRRKMIADGVALLTLVVDADGHVDGEPELTLLGVVDPIDEEEERAHAVHAVRLAVERLRPAQRRQDPVVQETARLAARRTLQRRLDKKPVTQVHLVRLQ